MHFIMHCDKFSKIRNEMFNKINAKMSETTIQFLARLTPDIYCFILLGMDTNIPPDELFDLRKISMSYIYKLYLVRQDLN